MTTNFNTAFINLIGLEGGYVNDPYDPGGETKFGISKRAYPDEDIKNMTAERAKEIYYNDWWKALRLDQIDAYLLQEEIFELAVNVGKSRGVKIVQRALNYLGDSHIRVDGILGNQTIQAINNWSDKDQEADLHNAINGCQFAWYLTITEAKPSLRRFSRGWLKRIYMVQ